MKYLSELIKGTNTSKLESFLGNDLLVTEKIDGNHFSMVWDGDEFSFSKRGGKAFGIHTRIFDQRYEPLVKFFDSLDQSIKDEIKNKTFEFEYIPSTKTQIISYDRTPLNDLILLGVSENKKPHFEPEILFYYSNLLKVESTPIIYSGKLSQSQMDSIFGILGGEFPEDTPFAKYVYSIFNNKSNKTTLNNNLTKEIEGIVFTNKSNGESYKVNNPFFIDSFWEKRNITPDANEYKENFKTAKLNFLNSFNKFFVEGSNDGKFNDLKTQINTLPKNNRFVNLLAELFKRYIEEAKMESTTPFIELVKTQTGFESTFMNIENVLSEDLYSWLNENEELVLMFRLLINNYKPDRKRFTDGGMDSKLVWTGISKLLLESFVHYDIQRNCRMLSYSQWKFLNE